VTKNFFAGSQFSVWQVAWAVIAILLFNFVPFVALLCVHGWPLAMAIVAVIIALSFHAGVDVVMRVSPLYALTHPLGSLLFVYMLLRSTVVTLRQGGIIWRGTFYSLEELKRGAV
jgi:hypothetical protein